MGRAALQAAGAGGERAGRRRDPHAGAAQARLRAAGIPGSRSARWLCSWPAPPWSSPSPTTSRCGAVAEAHKPFAEAAGRVGERLGPVFEFATAGDQMVEAAVDGVGEVAQAVDFVADRGEHPGQDPRFGGALFERGFVFASASSFSARRRARARPLPRTMGSSERMPRARVRLPAAVLRWPSERRLVPAASVVEGVAGRSPPASAARPRPSAIRPAPCCACSAPSPSRPLPSAAPGQALAQFARPPRRRGAGRARAWPGRPGRSCRSR